MLNVFNDFFLKCNVRINNFRYSFTDKSVSLSNIYNTKYFLTNIHVYVLLLQKKLFTIPARLIPFKTIYTPTMPIQFIVKPKSTD